ncbi:hypothetical protein MRX96_050004 [Rhipicephalus microplus]
MHPEHEKGRRKSRVRYLSPMLEDILESHTLYMDTARTNDAYTSVVLDATDSLQNSVAMRRTHAAHDEILAVALVTPYPILVLNEVYMLTDSQQACRVFLSGHGIPRAAHPILKFY